MEKYPVVGLVRGLLAFIGWATLAIAVIVLLLGLANVSQTNNPLAVTQGWFQIVSAVPMAVSGLVSVAISEAISIFVNMEMNTRAIDQIAQLLSRQFADPAASAASTLPASGSNVQAATTPVPPHDPASLSLEPARRLLQRNGYSIANPSSRLAPHELKTPEGATLQARGEVEFGRLIVEEARRLVADWKRELLLQPIDKEIQIDGLKVTKRREDGGTIVLVADRPYSSADELLATLAGRSE